MRWSGIYGIALLTVLAAGQAHGQAPPPAAPPAGSAQAAPEAASQDHPQSGVARISLIHGDVSTQRGDSGDWVAATLNTPVVAGDKVSTGPSSRTEVQLDYANVLRLSDQSQANIASLDRARIQVQVAQGLVFYTVFKGTEADAEIDTPNVAVHPRGEGEFRIQVSSSGETVVTIRKGEADLTTSEGSTRVHKGQAVTIRGTGADAQYQTADAPSKDGWDRWNEDRDKTIRSAESWSHVDPYYTGAHDLDAYGHWVNVPGYGWAWCPAVAPGWAPYRVGNWVWEPYYGWTWVSYEPWGWAPYHYGRWFLWSGSWAWWPGPVIPRYRPIWAPAYVSFFGFGAGRFGLSFGLGFGSVGWFPIGPCDPFFPWYGASAFRFGFVDSFRFHERTFFGAREFGGRFPGAFRPLAGRFDDRFSNFRMADRDPRVLRGVTSVRAEEFGRGTGQRAAGVSVSDFRGGHIMTGSVPVVPTRESLSPSGRAASPATIRGEQGTRFFSRSQPSPAPSSSFNEQAGRVREALRGGGASSLQREAAAPSGATRPGGEAARAPSRAAEAAGTSESWRRFGGSNEARRPGGNGPAAQPNRGAGNERTVPAERNISSSRPSRSSEMQGARPPQSSQAGGNSGGWQRFSRQPGESATQSPGAGGRGPASQPRSEGASPYGRGPSPGYGNRPSYNAPRYDTRPPLNLHRPIISGPPRSAPGGYGQGSRGGFGGGPRGGSGGGRSSAPSRRR